MGGELPLLPFGNPIGFVPASRGGGYIELIISSMGIKTPWTTKWRGMIEMLIIFNP